MRIAILSRSSRTYSTRSLAEAAERAGHEAVVMDPWQCALYIRSGSPRVTFNGQPADRFDAVIPRLGSATAEYGIEVVRQLEFAGAVSVNRSGAIETARHKWRSLQAFEAAGLPIPPTFAAGDANDVDPGARRIGGYPFIAKPFQGTQGSGIVLLETPNSARSALDALWNLRRNYIAQRFYPEADGVDIRAFVINGEAVAAMRRVASKGEFRANLHRGGSGYKMRLGPRLERIAVQAAKAVGLDVAGVDMLQAGEDAVLLEANPSPGLEGMETAAGVDIAGRIVALAETLVQKRRSP